jgi:hypothetical protein
MADDDRWRIRLTRRVRIGSKTVPAGTVLAVAADHLRVAAFHCRVGAAVPFNERTATAVELFEACRALDEVTA